MGKLYNFVFHWFRYTYVQVVHLLLQVWALHLPLQVFQLPKYVLRLLRWVYLLHFSSSHISLSVSELPIGEGRLAVQNLPSDNEDTRDNGAILFNSHRETSIIHHHPSQYQKCSLKPRVINIHLSKPNQD